MTAIAWPDLAQHFPEPVTDGPWRITTWAPTPEEIRAARFYDAAHGGTGRASQLVAGKRYVQLFYRGHVMMSDTPMELDTNGTAVRMAKGDVLIGGLGLGLVALAIRAKRSVTSVTVIEQDPILIDLMRKHVPPLEAVTIVQGDVWTYKAKKKAYDTIYLDIWQNMPNREDKVEMAKLRRRYTPALSPKGWVGCWAEQEPCRW